MSTALTPAPEGASPALPALFGDSAPSLNDFIIPMILPLQSNSDLVKAREARDGDVVWVLGNEDPDPIFLIGGDDKDAPTTFNAWVVGMEKFAATTTGGFRYQTERDHSDPGSWEGYYAYLAIPELDEFFPAKLRLWRSSASLYKKILSLMTRRAAAGDDSPLYVKFGTTSRTNDKGTWNVLTVAPAAQTDPDEMLLAKRIQHNTKALIAAKARENDRPAAVDVEQPDIN